MRKLIALVVVCVGVLGLAYVFVQQTRNEADAVAIPQPAPPAAPAAPPAPPPEAAELGAPVPEAAELDPPIIIAEEPVMMQSEAFVAAAPVLEELMVIVEGDEYHIVNLFFATNRQLSNDPFPDTPADQFTADMGPLRYGVAEVSIPKNHVIGHLESQNLAQSWLSDPNPRKHVILQSMDLQEPEAVMDQLRAVVAQGGTSTLMYIHGFNVGVDTAARRAGQLTYDLDWNGPSFFFSWPSLDSATAYNADQEKARASRRDLESVLERIAATETDRIVIIAHSMGTDLLAQALELLDARQSPALDKIETVILAAPDINELIFRASILPAITAITERNPNFTVTVYASERDSALQLSEITNGALRIGVMSTITDAQREALRPVLLVDASQAQTNFFGHTYINDNAAVIEDVYCILRKGPDPTIRITLEGVPQPEGPGFRIPPRERNASLDNADQGAQFVCD
ncbi:Esterase/lipase superfamily enzyme [Cognatiyoonia koreensis]|uniref:Esterase/lipase superfamily enzyme n=1 Tax=Cognatiyoonia koreensis TaxID=364200 RepID=A0A1I0N2H6_9RHOB|nr:alpha/beta hydrolase [Cognatiyoonia koreensis]SEV95015.1 Esterase/lipase superfamily enzyme [Cognatiyoonia koreensis]